MRCAAPTRLTSSRPPLHVRSSWPPPPPPRARHNHARHSGSVVAPTTHGTPHMMALGKECSSCCACERGCVFCGIVKDAGQPGSPVLFQDELVVVIRDIRPAAAQHLLVMPRSHIPNVDSLAAADAGLVRHMLAVGQQLLAADAPQQPQQQQQQQQPEEQQQHQQGQQQQAPPPFKFGFHKPPFRSVDHLHLHCFQLPHKWYRWVQYQHSINWITADELMDRLARMPSRSPGA